MASEGSGPGAEGPISDVAVTLPVVRSVLAYEGRVWDVVSETFDLGDGGVVTRDFVKHPGAVAIMAYRDPGEVLLVHQYRHPVRRVIWEPPAGLLDVADEDPLAAAQRELFEEADVTADEWHVLLDVYTSPGGSAEAIRIYLARGISDVPVEQRFEREAEERGMPIRWVPLADALAAAHGGAIHGPTTIAGLFALDAAVRSGWATLRPAGAPWDRP